MSLLHMAKESGKLESSVSMQNMITSISDAIFWQDIEEAFLTFFENLSLKNVGEDGVSLLVQKAIQHIQEYYNQGITLEEVAAKLHVSEEYLSTQFKKQTGRTFTCLLYTSRPYCDVTIEERFNKQIDEKRAIARVAASYVKDGDVIAIDPSTTTLHMCSYLQLSLIHI